MNYPLLKKFKDSKIQKKEAAKGQTGALKR
jgi:hypothetical protein